MVSCRAAGIITASLIGAASQCLAQAGDPSSGRPPPSGREAPQLAVGSAGNTGSGTTGDAGSGTVTTGTMGTGSAMVGAGAGTDPDSRKCRSEQAGDAANSGTPSC